MNVRTVPWTDPKGVEHLLIFSVNDAGVLVCSNYKPGTGFVADQALDKDCGGFAPKSPISVLVGAQGKPFYIHVSGFKPDGKHHQVACDGTKWFATL